MIFATTGWVDVLIPLVAGIVILLLPIRPKSPDEPAEKVNARRRLTRLCELGAICVALLYFVLMKAGGK